MDYNDFLASKRIEITASGFTPDALNPALFPFQADITRWALERGKAALFEDCGTGKTLQQLDWSEQVVRRVNKPVLILAPLAVSKQTVREGQKFGIEAHVAVEQSDVVRPGIYITNYEKLHHFDPSAFGGVVLDESSILKSFTGTTRNQLIEAFGNTPMRLACTATPAPNDHMELGNHSEFLGVLTRTEMLSTFFVHDGGETSKWRLKGHAEEEYWKWVCAWAVMLRQPSDLGYDNDGFVLPPLNYHHHVVKNTRHLDGFLFATEAQSLMERRQARRNSLNERVEMCAALVNESTEPWLIWCDLNDEGDQLTKLIPDAVQVAGRDKDTDKEDRMLGFSEGRFRVLVSKPSICGWGMNYQHCANVGFVGLSDSWEQWYQAIRRCWRFGQTKPVNCHVFSSEAEGAVVRNIERKEADAARMAKEMVKHMSVYSVEALHQTVKQSDSYQTKVESGQGWKVRLGDCVEGARSMADDSVHFSIYSPPFASLYTYSASGRDMGNVRTHAEFYEHFKFLTSELYRILMPGRLMSVHCMNLPTSKERDGVIGISDFRGDLIRIFQDAGFIYHSEVCIWKNPVTAMQRTKALGLLHRQLVKDSCMSRQGIPDYLVTMRKPGDNPERVTGALNYYVGDDPSMETDNHWNPEFPVPTTETRNSINIWQRYASPVWMDIDPSDTLQRESAREERDERHIAPLQLQVIERALQLWTNPGDLVYSPFAGIGSEGYKAIPMGRRFEGDELKFSYWKQAVANLRNAESAMEQDTLFKEALA
jgi:DNA modification methylase